MKIDMENVFIGTIRVQATHCIFTSRGYIVYACEGEENVTSVLKENAILLKIKDGEYVDLDLLNNFLDEIKIKKVVIPETVKIGKETRTITRTNREQTLEELILLHLANENPAFKPFAILFDDSELSKNELYDKTWATIQKFAKTYNTKVYAPIQIKEEVKKHIILDEEQFLDLLK
mgnify:CR=1 FL=1